MSNTAECGQYRLGRTTTAGSHGPCNLGRVGLLRHPHRTNQLWGLRSLLGKDPPAAGRYWFGRCQTTCSCYSKFSLQALIFDAPNFPPPNRVRYTRYRHTTIWENKIANYAVTRYDVKGFADVLDSSLALAGLDFWLDRSLRNVTGN